MRGCEPRSPARLSGADFGAHPVGGPARITDNLNRYSVGIEDAKDLIADLAQVLNRASTNG